MSDEPASFFVCLYKEDGGIIRIRTSYENAFPSLKEAGADQPKVDDVTGGGAENSEAELGSSNAPRDDFSKIFHMFCASIVGYMDFLPMLSSVLPSLGYSNRIRLIDRFLEDHGELLDEDQDRKIFRVATENRYDFIGINERYENVVLVGKQVPKMMIIGLVSSYEHHTALLIREILKRNPQRLESSTKEILIKDVFEAGTLEDLREVLIERELDKIMRDSFDSQVNWIQEQCKSKQPIKENYDKWNSLVELFERRNLFAHADGVVNSTYLKNTKALKIDNAPAKGQELLANRSYMAKAMDNICEFGVKLIQVAWRKFEPMQSAEADDALGDFGFELISRGRYKLATRMLEYANSLRGTANDKRKLMNTVNLANAYQLSKNRPKADEVLNAVHWSVLSPLFQICVSAVRGEAEVVSRMMLQLADTAEISSQDYESWPVFFHVRDDIRFKENFKFIFGREYNPKAEHQNSALADFRGQDNAADDRPPSPKRLREDASAQAAEMKPPGAPTH